MSAVGLSLTLPQTEKPQRSKPGMMKALALETIKAVRVTVSDMAGNPLTSLISAAASGETVTLFLEVPVGPNRIFVVEIIDQEEKVLLLGSAVADLVSGPPVVLEVAVTQPLTVNPEIASVPNGQVRQFQATLSPALLGLLVDPQLDWRLEDSVGNPLSIGALTPTGTSTATFLAPDRVPAVNIFFLKVASRERPHIFESAAISIIQARIVDNNKGIDQDGCGTVPAPCKTLTKGLDLAQAGEIVLVKPGVYPFDSQVGESTPLQLKPGVTIEGQTLDGVAAVLDFRSPSDDGGIGILGADNATLRGLTLENHGNAFNTLIETNGHALVIEDNILNNFCDDCTRPVGVSVTGGGSPTLFGNRFGDFDAGGFSTALHIQDEATPIVEGNRFVGNFVGVQVEGAAGPDLGGGASGSLGNNILSCNEDADLFNNTSATLFAQGNQWDHQPPEIGFGLGNGGSGIDIALSRLSGSGVDAARGILYPASRCNFGVSVIPSAGLVTTEAGGRATFTINLNAAPTSDVMIGLSSSDLSEGTVFPSSLVFTVENWKIPQTVTVTGVDDNVADGDVAYRIIVAPPVTNDIHYASYDPDDVSVINRDNDRVGITINPISGLVTTEVGGTASFTIVLQSQPTASVTIGLSSSDTTEGTVSPSSLTFTTVNWNQARSVTVTGVDDAVVDGDIVYSIITAAAVSSDTAYNGFNPSDVAVTNRDNDSALHTLTVRTAGTGRGTVTSIPGKINCGQGGQNCTEDFAAGTQVRLSAVADKSSVFSRWSGDCSGTGTSASVTMNGDRTCVAEFRLVYIFKANFDSDVIENPPNVNPPAQGDQVWDHLELVTGQGGTILVQGKVGDLGKQPLVLDSPTRTNGAVTLRGFVEGKPPTGGVYIVRWRSLLNSNPVVGIPANIAILDSEGVPLGFLSYLIGNLLDFNGLSPQEGIGVRWTLDVAQDFEVIVDLDRRTLSLAIDGSAVSEFQDVAFANKTAGGLAEISAGVNVIQRMGVDDIEVLVK